MPWRIKNNIHVPNIYTDAKDAFAVFGNDLTPGGYGKLSTESIFLLRGSKLLNNGHCDSIYTWVSPDDAKEVLVLEMLPYLEFVEDE